MGKLSYNDKLRMQTLLEQGLAEKAIISSYPDKGWKMSTVEKVCSRDDHTGSAILRKPGSGRSATAFSFYGWILKTWQGSVLSPFLFAVYLDDIWANRQIIPSYYVIIYADDILLVSSSICEFDICERELMWLDMVINVKKIVLHAYWPEKRLHSQ